MPSVSATTQGAPVEAPISPPKPISVEESAQAERVGESALIPAETPTPWKEVTPASASQTRSASPTIPPVISTNDPFIAFSQAIKDGSSLVVTPSSIPNSATHGPDADFSSNEGSEKALKDSEDEPIIRMRVYDSNEEGEPETEAMGMSLVLKRSSFYFLSIISWYQLLTILCINFLSHTHS